MGDWPSDLSDLGPAGTLHTCSPEAIGDAILLSGLAWASGAWPANNRALFIPFTLATPATILKILISNTGTIGGNIDAGIYDVAGNQIVSFGSTAQTSGVQILDIADTYLPPGNYFMALALSTTPAGVNRITPSVTWLEMLGVQQMASAFPLPGSVTFANPASAYVPAMALALTTVL